VRCPRQFAAAVCSVIAMGACCADAVAQAYPNRPIRLLLGYGADGGLVILDERGCPQWHRLQRRHVIRDALRIRQAAAEDPAAIFCFDLLWLNGADLHKRSLLDRKSALYRTLPANRRVRYAKHINDSCEEVWELAVQIKLEGVVAKDVSSIYTGGRRTRWQKIQTDVGAERETARRPA
jgi:ATP-dependent DNA ligase